METELIFEGDLGSVFTTSNVEGSQATEVVLDGITGDIETTEAVAGIPITMETTVTEEVVEQDIITTTVEGNMDQVPIVIPIPVANQPDKEISLEDELKSTERLDRSSPDLWPQNPNPFYSCQPIPAPAVPSAAQHILAKNASKTGEPEANLGIWAQGLDPEDINLLHQFGSLTSSSLVEEVKKLQNIAYQLGLEEAKEMTRGKLLHVLDDQENTSKQEKESHVQRLWK